MSGTSSVYKDNEIDVVALLRMTWGYKYFIAGVVALCVAVAVVMALTATPIYQADVVVTPVRDTNMGSTTSSLMSQFSGLAGLAGVNLGSAGVNQEAQAVLESRRLVEEFIKRGNLLQQLYPDARPPPSLWETVRQFRRTVVSTLTDKRTSVTTVSMKWKDPVAAAKWANDFIALANELIRVRTLENSSRNIAYLNRQLAQTDSIEVRRVMYSLIESETKTLMLANARTEYAFTIVDPAVAPESRVSPRRTIMVLSGGALGLLLGVLLAFAHHRLWRGRR